MAAVQGFAAFVDAIPQGGAGLVRKVSDGESDDGSQARRPPVANSDRGGHHSPLFAVRVSNLAVARREIAALPALGDDSRSADPRRLRFPPTVVWMNRGRLNDIHSSKLEAER